MAKTKKQDLKAMRAVVARVGEAPVVQVVDATLEGLQEIVGGYVTHWKLPQFHAVVICNEEGIPRGLPLNRVIHGQPFVGNFVVLGLKTRSANWSSLTEAEAKEIAAFLAGCPSG